MVTEATIQVSPVASGYCVSQLKYRTFSSSEKILLHGAVLQFLSANLSKKIHVVSFFIQKVAHIPHCSPTLFFHLTRYLMDLSTFVHKELSFFPFSFSVVETFPDSTSGQTKITSPVIAWFFLACWSPCSERDTVYLSNHSLMD